MKKLFLILMVLLSASGLYAVEKTDTLRFVYKLHGQTRKFRYVFEPQSDGGVTLHWGKEILNGGAEHTQCHRQPWIPVIR